MKDFWKRYLRAGLPALLLYCLCCAVFAVTFRLYGLPLAAVVYPALLCGAVWLAYALLRRTYDFGASAPLLEHRGALLNTGDNSLTYGGEKIELTKNEYRILLGLMQSKGKTVSREKLMELLWESDEFVDDNTLTVNVGRLRKKLEAAGLRDFIATKHGVGYLIQ